ncbi:MAG: homoserine dehydrogenase [Phycisphaeraceae bacterium]|nr:homoserine dehydrogenase [Phycisphaeraceae bacterium]MCW5762029.1 homoserine dehydrogenase [Phycisphaeraceae bacterium]
MHRPLIVLKLGGSVLTSETTLRRAVHEIYRWRREGWRVVAVVSALAGETDTLLNAAHRACPDAPSASVAGLAAIGESRSAALLALALDRAGLPAATLSPAAVGLRATGDPRDADPVALDRTYFDAWFDRDYAIIVPGFTGIDNLGRTVTLGRGGSDLTALHLAYNLGAECCRLVKDVDGLYVSDPARPGPEPLRYEHATYDDALATDGSIIQHKALRYAAARNLSFEIGRLNGTRPTRIGPGETRVSHKHDRPHPKRVAILGLGTVGLGVFDLLQSLEDDVVISAVLARDHSKQRSIHVPAEYFASSITNAVRDADIVVEVIGGLETPRTALHAALERSASVVTANKALIASDGPHLKNLARENNCSLHASASVGGSVPVLERIASRPGHRLCALRGILNGTTNFILDQLAQGQSIEAAIIAAQALGFAEADPSRDLLGIDAAEKLCVIAQHEAVNAHLTLDSVAIESLADGLRRLGPPKPARNVRHLATLSLDHEGSITAQVGLALIDAGDPLAAIHGSGNAVELIWDDGVREFISGRGAGRWPTAEAVVADVLTLCRQQRDVDSALIAREVQHA